MNVTDYLPDGIDPIVAYRSWRTDGNGFLYPSLARKALVKWPHGEPLKASCYGGQKKPIPKMVKTKDLPPESCPESYPYYGNVTASSAASSASMARTFPLLLQSKNSLFSVEEPAAHSIEAPPGYTIIEERIPCESPDEDCSCGIYAVSDLRRVPSWNDGVTGEVYLWGKVIEGTQGYRAEFAYPKCFYFEEKNEKRIRVLAESYGVEMVPKPQLFSSPTTYESTSFSSLLTNLTKTSWGTNINGLDDPMPMMFSSSAKKRRRWWLW